MLILGINSYHGDSSACIVRNGRVIAAVEEERLRRIKHWAGFPSESINYCLQEARAKISDLDFIAINSNPKATFLKKIAFALSSGTQVQVLADRMGNYLRREKIKSELEGMCASSKFKGKISRVEHHIAHLSSSFLVSPFREACVISIDGFGDFSSAAWGVGIENSIDIEQRIYFPHSLGIFYQGLTQFLGFPNYGDEYKVMGLAPYGKPTYLTEMREIVRLMDDGLFELELGFFRHSREKIDYTWDKGAPRVGALLTDKIEQLLGKPRLPNEPLLERHMDIARSVQVMYEQTLFHILNSLHSRHGSNSIALAGGCAMNSVANGKILKSTSFKRVYIPPAAGDAGGAIGAAIYTWFRHGPEGGLPRGRDIEDGILRGDDDAPRHVMSHAYLGPEAKEEEITSLLSGYREVLERGNFQIERAKNDDELFEAAATAISKGSVVGWFQGRLEWGPRALGNRSIVCDPRRSDMKQLLNAKIKRRESFRPFAPSILREHVSDWFEADEDVPFMMQVFQIRAVKAGEIPAVTHVDGSGRLQTVYKETNPRYWGLIDAFRRKTGVPILLNTSFNENEPVVCRPSEALDCFLRTEMDMLVLNNWIIRRRGN